VAKEAKAVPVLNHGGREISSKELQGKKTTLQLEQASRVSFLASPHDAIAWRDINDELLDPASIIVGAVVLTDAANQPVVYYNCRLYRDKGVYRTKLEPIRLESLH
jgi:hypothetical protein